MAPGRLPDGRVPVLLSAHEDELIAQDAAAILRFVKQVGAIPDIPGAVATTLLRTRRVRRHRALIRAADRTELEDGLRALAQGDDHPLVARSTEKPASKTAFVFPGQGREWPSMGAEAYEGIPAYRGQAQQCAQAFTAAGLPSPLRYLRCDRSRDFSQTEVQAAHFTHAVSLAQVWRSGGVAPEITIGHSLGEVAAAYVAGVISLPAAVGVVGARAAVVGRLPGRYGMAALGVGADQAKALIAETPGWLEISVLNSASSSVVSGDRAAVAACVRLAEQRGVFARQLAVDFPAHTSRLETLRTSFGDLLPVATFRDGAVDFVSSAHGDVVGADADFNSYWYENLRNTVRFGAAVNCAAQRGAGTYIEMSAHPSLLYAIGELAEDALVVGSGSRDEPIADRLSAGIATVGVHDARFRRPDPQGSAGPPLLWGFPPAPMRGLHLWATAEPVTPAPAAHPRVFHEQWESRPPTRDDGGFPPSGALVIEPPGDANDAVAQLLTDAAAAQHQFRLTGREEAEVAVIVAPAIAQADVGEAADQLARGAGMIEYRRLIGPNCRRVWLVTTGAEQVHRDDPRGLPGQAALTAMHRSVGFEFPDVTFAHLDLPSAGADIHTARCCVDQLMSPDTEIALRRNGSEESLVHRFVPTLREDVAPSAPMATTARDNVVITGGNGTIGQRYARHCIAAGARRIVLLSRRGGATAELQRSAADSGTELHAPVCDITDPRAVKAAADEFAGEGATLLIHAAGAATFAPHDQLTADDLTGVLSAKITGLERMVEGWPLAASARILLCSSVSGVWGGYGHAAYAASNRLLDSLAAELRADGRDCTAVRWGLWQDTTIADGQEITRIERSGLIAMDPDAAVSLSLSQQCNDPLIVAADLARLRTFFESQGLSMPFATHVTESAAEVRPPSGASVADVVRVEIATVLSLDGPASVDLNVALVDLGADSMLALDLRDRLRRATGESIAAARLLGGMTGSDLIDALTPDRKGETPA
ncbi:mycobactin polyketide synthase MbtD [Mycobacterium camsae]|uniref:mycobactin polyketide synthase MbtD n=1 Tax=Mycobacterium gordonae TaxID=1778 RepID=UPI00197E098D|nr:mycobactin polyketide synthase MbtD [Mycobacterium gordonae]